MLLSLLGHDRIPVQWCLQAQQDEAERAADAPAVAAATQAEGTGVLARLLAFFSAIWAAVTRSFASLFGGSGSAPAAA